MKCGWREGSPKNLTLTSDKVFQDLMECKECSRIKARVACIPGGYPPSEAQFDLGMDSNKCMYESGD